MQQRYYLIIDISKNKGQVINFNDNEITLNKLVELFADINALHPFCETNDNRYFSVNKAYNIYYKDIHT